MHSRGKRKTQTNFQPSSGVPLSDPGIDATSNSAACGAGSGLISNNNSDSQGSGGGLISTTSGIHNGNNDETLFTKPPARDGMTAQVIKVYFVANLYCCERI